MLTSSRASTAASPSPYFLVTWLAEAAIPARGSMLGWVLGEAGSWTVVCTRSPSAGRPGYAATSSTLEGADLSGIRADAARTPGISLYRGCRDSAADSATSSSCGGGGPRRRDSSRFRTTSALEVQLVARRWCGRCRRRRGPESALGGQVLQDGQHPSVVLAGDREVEAGEDVADVGLDCLLGQEQRPADGAVGAALRHAGEHSSLALAEALERVANAPAAHKLGDHGGIDDETPSRDPTNRVDQLFHIIDAVLEEVAGAAGGFLDEAQRIVRLDVLRQHEYTSLWVVAADGRRSQQTLGSVGRRHADVEDCDIGWVHLDPGHQLVGIPDLGENLQAGRT